jgi:hypothetical protein
VDILLSKYYHLQLLPPWMDLAYDCQVIATVSKDTISEIDDFNIRNTFFTPYGIGLATYLATVQPTTPVHMVHLFKSKDPFELDSTINVFLPDTIVDNAGSREFKIGKKVSYALGLGGYRYFPEFGDENTFIKKSTAEIVKSLGNTESFVADIVSASYSAYDVLLEQSEIDAFEATTKQLLQFKKDAIVQERVNLEASRNELYEQKIKMIEAEKQHEDAQVRYHELTANLAGLQTSLQEENQILTGVKGVMIEIINQIKAGLLDPADFTNFIDIYNSVKNGLSGTR